MNSVNNNPIKIKICGMTRKEDIILCNKLGVDWVGFVFYKKSPRFITAYGAKKLSDSIPSANNGGIKRVGLFVNPSFQEIEDVLEITHLDVLQLYTSLEKALEIKKYFHIETWLSNGVENKYDLPSSSALDGYIIEAKSSKNDNLPGGIGKKFNWNITKKWDPSFPWILAGGLTSDNVIEAIEASHTKAVDVSSGIEDKPGIKSHQKTTDFVNKIQLWGCSHDKK